MLLWLILVLKTKYSSIEYDNNKCAHELFVPYPHKPMLYLVSMKWEIF